MLLENIKNKILNNDTKLLSSTFLDQIFVSAGNFFTTFLLIRFLGLKDFGLFSAIWIIIISANLIQQAFIINPFLSISSKLEGHLKKRYIVDMKFQQIVFSLIISILFFFIVITNKNIFGVSVYGNEEILFMFLSMSIIQFYEFCRRTLYVSSELKNLLKMDSLKYFIQLSFLLIFLSIGLKSSNIILLIFDFSCILSISLFNKDFHKLKFDINSFIGSYKRNWNISKWLIFTSIFQWLQSSYLLFLTNFILGPTALGVLRASQSILGISNILLHSIDSWVPVKTSKELINQTPQIFTKNIMDLSRKMTLLFFIIFLLLVFSSKFILKLYNPEIIEYLLIFRLYCLTYLIMSINYPIKNILLGLEKTFSSLISYLLSIILIFIFGKPLITYYGLTGTIITFLISNISILSINLYYLNRKINHLNNAY